MSGVVCMGFAQDLLVEFSHALKVTDPSDEIAGRPGTYKTFTKNALNTRLQSDARSYAMIQKLLSGTWLQKIRWARCGTNPPRCGDILLQDPGWLTSYQIGHEAWPSCADFNRHPKPAADTLPFDGAGTLLAGEQQTPPDDKAARACTMLDIPIMSGYSGVSSLSRRVPGTSSCSRYRTCMLMALSRATALCNWRACLTMSGCRCEQTHQNL